MLLAALRDMQWRKRRFVIAILSHRHHLRDDARAHRAGERLPGRGAANGRCARRRRIPGQGRARPARSSGRRRSRRSTSARIAAAPGVQAAAPLVYAGGTVTLGDATRNADLFGAPERGPGMPVVSEGRPPAKPERGRGVEHARAQRRRGHRKSLRAGCASSASSRTPRHWPTCPTSSSPPRAPSNWCTAANRWSRRSAFAAPSTRCRRAIKAIDRDGAVADLLRPLKVAVNSITIVAILLWVVAALIVGSVIYLSALERLRDFAVFKAIGVPTRFDRGRTGAAGGRGGTVRRRRRRRAFGDCSGRCSRCRSSSRRTPTSSCP